MAAPESPSAAGRPRAGRSGSRPAKLSREGIVDGALTFLDREGWDSLTINALATQLGTKGLDGEDAFYAAIEFWSAMHGFVLLEMTGVMDDIDTDALFSDMVLRLATGLERRTAHNSANAT